MLLFSKPYLLTFLDEVYTDAVQQAQKKSEIVSLLIYYLSLDRDGGWGWYFFLFDATIITASATLLL